MFFQTSPFRCYCPKQSIWNGTVFPDLPTAFACWESYLFCISNAIYVINVIYVTCYEVFVNEKQLLPEVYSRVCFCQNIRCMRHTVCFQERKFLWCKQLTIQIFCKFSNTVFQIFLNPFYQTNILTHFMLHMVP